MSHHEPLHRRRLAYAIALAAAIVGFAERSPAAERPPNVVLIFIDDMAYADIGPFGATGY